MSCNIDTKNGCVGFSDQQSRPGCEVLQSCADRDDQVRVAREFVRSAGSGDTDGARVKWMIPGQGAFACLGFRNGNAVFAREACKFCRGARVVDAAAGDNQRLPCFANRVNGRFEFIRIRSRSQHSVCPGIKKRFGIVVGFCLYVLRQGDCDRSALDRVRQDCDRLRQRLQQLFGSRDPIPVSRHRSKTVIRRNSRIAKILNLLQNGIRQPVCECFAGKKEYRQSIYVSQCGGCHHVGRAGAD